MTTPGAWAPAHTTPHGSIPWPGLHEYPSPNPGRSYAQKGTIMATSNTKSNPTQNGTSTLVWRMDRGCEASWQEAVRRTSNGCSKPKAQGLLLAAIDRFEAKSDKPWFVANGEPATVPVHVTCTEEEFHRAFDAGLIEWRADDGVKVV